MNEKSKGKLALILFPTILAGLATTFMVIAGLLGFGSDILAFLGKLAPAETFAGKMDNAALGMNLIGSISKYVILAGIVASCILAALIKARLIKK